MLSLNDYYFKINDSSGSGGNVDTLKNLLDTTKSCYQLFNNFTGSSVEELIRPYHTSNVVTMKYMFSSCTNLETIPELDTSKVTDMKYMFSGCTNLETIPELDTSKVTDMTSMFNGCTSLTEISIDTSNSTKISKLFYECTNLKSVSLINMINITSDSGASQIFDGCKNLTNLTIKNIKINLYIGSYTKYGHLLTLDSLINTCKECINVGSSRLLTMSTTSKNNLANVYVKFTDSSVTSIASGEKGEVEVCESTDDGAMLISDYMSLKNWTIAS